jgi:hypothetical protein
MLFPPLRVWLGSTLSSFFFFSLICSAPWSVQCFVHWACQLPSSGVESSLIAGSGWRQPL